MQRYDAEIQELLAARNELEAYIFEMRAGMLFNESSVNIYFTH
jgi:hypothetical protein